MANEEEQEVSSITKEEQKSFIGELVDVLGEPNPGVVTRYDDRGLVYVLFNWPQHKIDDYKNSSLLPKEYKTRLTPQKMVEKAYLFPADIVSGKIRKIKK
jgi:hypothetical protein